MEEKRLPIPQILIAASVVDSLLYLVYMNYAEDLVARNVASVIAIVVAIIGAAGGIWMQLIQFKKDSEKSEEIKLDTIDTRARVASIHEMADTSRSRMVPKEINR